MKYCETIKPGYYLLDDRCFYLTGKLKGNKWIYLDISNPEWMSLLWNCIYESEIKMAKYSETNPTKFNLKIS